MLNLVTLPSSIYQVVLTHALSVENEEVIGLLIGHWETVASSNPYKADHTTAIVQEVFQVARSDKRKDRVEISPEQLHLAVVYTEELEKIRGQEMSVIGWYHSHPHITVCPSHVDLRTQLLQQSMDNRFFGMIVSCFDATQDHKNRIQLGCFQSHSPDEDRVIEIKVPVNIQREDLYSLQAGNRMKNLVDSMYNENRKEYEDSFIIEPYSQKDESNQSYPSRMEESHKSTMYGQAILCLVDKFILPMTRQLELRKLAVEQEIELLKIQKKTQYKKFSQVTLIDLVGDSDEENTPQKNKHYTVSDSASLSSSNDVDPMCSGSQQELFYEAMETSGIHKTEDEEMEDFYVDENKESSSREAHLLDQVILARGLRSNVERTGSMKGIGLRHTYMRKRKPGFSKAKSEKTTDDNLIDLS